MKIGFKSFFCCIVAGLLTGCAHHHSSDLPVLRGRTKPADAYYISQNGNPYCSERLVRQGKRTWSRQCSIQTPAGPMDIGFW